MTGRCTSGVSWMGMVSSATTPKVTSIKTAAITAVGRPIAMRMRFIVALCPYPTFSLRTLSILNNGALGAVRQ